MRQYLQRMPLFDGYKDWTAADQARAIAEDLERTPPGRRAVTPFYILGRALKASEYPVDIVGIYERGSIDISRDVAALGHLGDQLRRRNITLDFLYCDNENDLTPWTFGLEKIQEVYRSRRARDRMPEAALRHDVDRLVFLTPEYHDWLLDFGEYANQLRIEALRKTLIDSGLLSPWSARTDAMNFFTIRTSFLIYDYNGWEYRNQTLVDSRTSCPVCMLSAAGHRYKGREHHPLWNSFIDVLNHARSGAASGPIAPVIREPLRAVGQPPGTVDPAGRWFMDQLIGHLIRSGADRFMFHHPGATPADDVAVAGMMRNHEHALAATPQTLPEITLDVDEVETGDFRTTYAEFLALGPERWDLGG